MDESNLRAATGLAAQAILLADPGLAPNQLIWKNRRYFVFTYEDTANTNNDKANAKNMFVYRDRGTVTQDGLWYEGEEGNNNQYVPSSMRSKIAFTTSDYTSSGSHTNIWTDKGNGQPLVVAKNDKGGNGEINGKRVIAFPLQQNKGNARFSIVVSRKGEVVESKILTDRKVKTAWEK